MKKTAMGYEAMIRRSGSKGGYRLIRQTGASCAGLDDALSLALVILVDGLEKSTLRALEAPDESNQAAFSGANGVNTNTSGSSVDAAASSAGAGPGASAPSSPPRPPKAAASSPPPSDNTRAAEALRLRAEVRRTPSAQSVFSFAIPQHGRVGVGAVVSGGILHQVGAGLTAEMILRWDAGWSLIGGGFWLSPETENYSSGHVHVSILTASLRPCRRIVKLAHELELFGCAAWHVGSIFGAGDGFPNSTMSSPWWMAAGVGPSIEGAAIGPVGFRVYGELLMPLRSQRFRVGNAIAYETGAVGGVGGVVAWMPIW